MPQDPPTIGADVTDLMPKVGEDVTDLMGSTASAKPEPSAMDLGVAFAKKLGMNALAPFTITKAMYSASQEHQQAAKDAAAKGDYAQSLLHAIGASGPGAMTDVMIIKPAQEQLARAQADLAAGKSGMAALHGVAMIPLVGPMAAGIAENVTSGDPMKQAEAAADVTSLALPNIVRGVSTAAKMVPAATRAAAADALDTMAAEKLGKFMAPTGRSKLAVGLGKTAAEKLAPELVKEGPTAITRAGYERGLKGGLEEATAELDAAHAAVNPSKVYGLNDVDQALAARQAKFTRTGSSGSVISAGRTERVKALEQARAELRALGPDANWQTLRDLKGDWAKSAEYKLSPQSPAYNQVLSDTAEGWRDATSELREYMAKKEPVEGANAKYSLYRRADDVMTAAKDIARTSEDRILSKQVARGGMVALGFEQKGFTGAIAAGLLAPVVEKLLTMKPTTQVVGAKMMSQLADAIRGKQTAAAQSALSRLGSLTGQSQLVNQALSGRFPAQPALAAQDQTTP